MYDDPHILAEYLLFHYGSAEEILPFAFGPKTALNFPLRTVGVADRFLKQCAACEGIETTPGRTRALDLGCAVGRSSFELARRFDSVLGLDFSRQFIDVARRLAVGEAIDYLRIDEGELGTPLTTRAPELPAGQEPPRFAIADACALPGIIEGEPLADFDLVHAANLLCRLPEPDRLLERLASLVRPGGLLVLATPCTWLAEFTPPGNWTGGRLVDGEPRRTLDGLRTTLEADFGLLEVSDCPFLIREHARKYQWSVSLLSVWERS